MGFVLPEIIDLAVMNGAERQTLIRSEHRQRFRAHRFISRIGLKLGQRPAVLAAHPVERRFAFNFLKPEVRVFRRFSLGQDGRGESKHRRCGA